MGCQLCRVVQSETEPAAEIDVDEAGCLHKSTVDFLTNVDLFKRLPKELHPRLATCCKQVEFDAGQIVIRQGDWGSDFFLIRSGDLSVHVDDVKVSSLTQGDYFGELALLRDEPRMATIRALTRVRALKVSRRDFEQLALKEKLNFVRRGAVGTGVRPLEVQPPSPKTDAERRLMLEALKSNRNLNNVFSVDDARANAMIDVAWKEVVPRGTEIISEGDTEADYFYIVQEGSFVIKKMMQKGAQSVKQRVTVALETKLGMIEPGGSFGELALMYVAPRAASVTAQTESIVWVIDRNSFKAVMARSTEENAKRYMEYLENVEVLKSLTDEERIKVAKALGEMTFSRGQAIFQQGESGQAFYILVQGEVDVIVDGKTKSHLSATPKKAEMFGERALLSHEPRAATIQVTSETCRTLVLDRVSFEMLVGPLVHIKKKTRAQREQEAKGNRESAGLLWGLIPMPAANASQDSRFGKIARADLKVLGLLGAGGFGSVELVEHVSSGETYALKSMSKGFVVQSGMQSNIIGEKTIQLMCDTPFIIRLYETYSSDQNLYLLLELALGGELFETYNRRGFHGREAHSKYYVAGAVFALEHLHGKKVIYRDLKPENLLLNDLGHVKLTDMGLAKVSLGKTYTTCGTPDYFAPEVIASSGHTHSVDWWTVGVLLYELMVGHTPFDAPAPMAIYQKVNKGIEKATFPTRLSEQCIDLIKSLCQQDPVERLPVKKGGVENIKTHAFYDGFEWERMQDLTLEPPYLPDVKSKKDIANFSAKREDMAPVVTYRDDGSGWDRGFATGQ